MTKFKNRNHALQMKANGLATAKEVGDYLGISERAVMTAQKKLRDEGEVQELKKSRGITNGKAKITWLKDKGISTMITHDDTEDWNEFFKEIKVTIKQLRPKYKKIKHTKVKDGHLLVVDVADAHFGKLATEVETGQHYNLKVAKKRFKEGLEGILQKSQGFNIEKIIFVIGNDILHIDSARRETSAGTPQDTDGMWYESFTQALGLYLETIHELLNIAPVHVIHCPSNHDYLSGWYLAQAVEQGLKGSGATFDMGIAHNKYFRYGSNFLMFTHGDGAKETDLGGIASKENKDFSSFEFAYMYLHHKHHKIAKDYVNYTVEYLRSISSADSWHHRNGYMNKPAVDGFILHKKQGQIARLTHYCL